ncbi:hypothetical protein SDC9_142761 [bioreactor metagenome]|uniref:Uncharacterized protein n=1 Tax=bioreactor metagenome TaxID=1076179 RepID=A0A645E216_9ZZZZ
MIRERVKDWMDMDAAEAFCRTHHIQMNGNSPAAHELEKELAKFLNPTGEFYTEGLSLDGYQRPKGWNRPFQIRAYPYRAQGKLIVNAEAAGSEVPIAEVTNIGNKASIIPSLSHTLEHSL